MKFFATTARAAVPALALAVISVPAARAAYVVTFVQSGSDVVATGSGSIDTTDLVNFSGHVVQSEILSVISLEFIGGQSPGDNFSGISGPAAFTTLSSGPGFNASSFER